MKIIGIIPARMESSRFPGKPLATILGMPMIGHVYSRCKMSNILDEVYVATCNQEIVHYIHSNWEEAEPCIVTLDFLESAGNVRFMEISYN